MQHISELIEKIINEESIIYAVFSGIKINLKKLLTK